MSEAKNNPNRLHKNPNYNVEQESIKNNHRKYLLQITINRTYNVNLPRNQSQKNSDTNIEDSVRYRAE